MLCRFCEKDKMLIQAHIDPRCLHEPLSSPKGPMMLLSKGSYPKRLQTGEYDDKILCADCDNGFAPCEEYAADLLIKNGAYERFQQQSIPFSTLSKVMTIVA